MYVHIPVITKMKTIRNTVKTLTLWEEGPVILVIRAIFLPSIWIKHTRAHARTHANKENLGKDWEGFGYRLRMKFEANIFSLKEAI